MSQSANLNTSKRCSRCGGKPKPLTSFYKHRGKPASECKQCTYARVRKWQRAHPERVREQNRRYREKHPAPKATTRPRLSNEERRARRRAYQRQYYADHLEVARTRHRRQWKQYYARHRAELNAKSRKYHHTHRELLKKHKRAYVEAHRDEIREYHREYWAKYSRTHRAQILARKAKYRARMRRQKRNQPPKTR